MMCLCNISCFNAAATFALVLWGWHHFSVRWIYPADSIAIDNSDAPEKDQEEQPEQDTENGEPGVLGSLISANKGILIVLLVLIAGFLIASFTKEDFLTGKNLISALVFFGFIIFAYVLNKNIKSNKSAVIGITVLVGLFVVGGISR